MKKSELRQIIREEIEKTFKEENLTKLNQPINVVRGGVNYQTGPHVKNPQYDGYLPGGRWLVVGTDEGNEYTGPLTVLQKVGSGSRGRFSMNPTYRDGQTLSIPTSEFERLKSEGEIK